MPGYDWELLEDMMFLEGRRGETSEYITDCKGNSGSGHKGKAEQRESEVYQLSTMMRSLIYTPEQREFKENEDEDPCSGKLTIYIQFPRPLGPSAITCKRRKRYIWSMSRHDVSHHLQETAAQHLGVVTLVTPVTPSRSKGRAHGVPLQ